MLTAMQSVRETLQHLQSSGGDYAAACASGAHLADLVLREMMRTKAPVLLAWVAKDIALSPVAGVAAGFFGGIADKAILGVPYHDAGQAGADGGVVEPKHGVDAAPVGRDQGGPYENAQEQALLI